MRDILICIAAGIILLAGCKGGETGKKVDMGPEAVVEAFTRHIAAGEFEEALVLCDSASMHDYIDEYISAWEEIEKRDSNVLAIASTILSEADFKVEKTEKTDVGREVYYSVEVNGTSKKKKAEIGKEEGEWRVRRITDAI